MSGSQSADPMGMGISAAGEDAAESIDEEAEETGSSPWIDTSIGGMSGRSAGEDGSGTKAGDGFEVCVRTRFGGGSLDVSSLGGGRVRS